MNLISTSAEHVHTRTLHRSVILIRAHPGSMMSSSALPSLTCSNTVDDIEDCVPKGSFPKPVDRIRNENKVLPRALRRKASSHTSSPSVGDSFIPGTHSIYVKTWGCSHNNSDGEYMAGLLGASGYTITGMTNNSS